MISSLCESLFVAIPKVEGTLECNKHRTISIMSRVTKVLLRVILKRIRSKISPKISEQQFGFVAGKGTANSIFSLRTVVERCPEEHLHMLCRLREGFRQGQTRGTDENTERIDA